MLRRRRSKTLGSWDESKRHAKTSLFPSNGKESPSLRSLGGLKKPKLSIDTELSMENKNELVTAWARNKIAAEGELLEVALGLGPDTVD